MAKKASFKNTIFDLTITIFDILQYVNEFCLEQILE